MPGREATAALAAVGVGPDTITPSEIAALDQDGYLVLDRLLSPAQLAAVNDAIDCHVPVARAAGTLRDGGTLHIENVVDAGPALDATWAAPRVLAAVAHLLGPDLQLDRVHYRAPRPGFGAQALHSETGAVAMLPLVDFTVENGATRVLPGSHHPHSRPSVSTEVDPSHPDEVVLACAAGSAIVFGGELWHSGRRNGSDRLRPALQISYRRRGPLTNWDTPDLSNSTVDRLGPLLALIL